MSATATIVRPSIRKGNVSAGTIERRIAAVGKAKIAKRKAAAAKPTVVERQYGLDKDKAKELKAAKAYNGYREGSSYGTVVEALHTLGMNRFHSAAKLIAAYQAEADKQSLKAFKSKKPRNSNGLDDWKLKIIQNAYVTTRQDYGKRMRDIGYEVRCERNAEGDCAWRQCLRPQMRTISIDNGDGRKPSPLSFKENNMSKSDFDRGFDAATNGLPIQNPYGDTARGEDWVGGYEQGCGHFSARMNGIIAFIKAEFTKPNVNMRLAWPSHCEICGSTADEFSLWESDDSGESFPLWLSYVVQGIGRDEGILK